MSDILALAERNTAVSRQTCTPCYTTAPWWQGYLDADRLKRVAVLTVWFEFNSSTSPSPTLYRTNRFFSRRSQLYRERATIIGCQFSFAAADGVACIAFKIEKDTNFPNALGQVLIAGPSLEKESLRRALRNCSDYNTRQECSGDVTGTVFDVFAELGVKDSPILGIKNATIKWAVP
jgi:hypothetical protein